MTPFPKLDDIKTGDMLIADGGFTCLPPGACREVKSDNSGLFVECEDGHHYIDGQRGDEGEYVGMMR